MAHTKYNGKRKRAVSSFTTRKRTKYTPKAPLYKSVVSVSNPFPKMVWRTLRYNTITTIAPGGFGLANYQTFRCLDVYDPDQTNAGHQAYGLDQMFAMYGRSQVTSSRIHVNFASSVVGATTANQEPPVLVGINISASPETSSDPAERAEKGGWRSSTLMNPKTSALNMAASTKLSTWAGGIKALSDPDIYGTSAAVQTGPTAYYSIWAAGTNNDTPGVIVANVTIEYNVKFYNPITIGQS